MSGPPPVVPPIVPTDPAVMAARKADARARALEDSGSTSIGGAGANGAADGLATNSFQAKLDAVVAGTENLRLVQGMPVSSQYSGAAVGVSANPGKEEQLKKLDAEQQRKRLDALFEKVSEEKLLELELIEMPSQLTQNTDLYEHQIQGISWMVENERSEAVPSYWREIQNGEKTKWRCKITRATTTDKPRPLRGSILADEMGLGKTVQSIGLILANPPDGQDYPYDSARSTTSPRCTLIVSPVSVMANWKLQIEQFCNAEEETLKVELFYGKNRRAALQNAQTNQVDVLLTSYHQLVSELKQWRAYQDELEGGDPVQAKNQRSLFAFDVDFHRIILDEAHEIRNADTWFFKACRELQAKYKLCLTGTPFVNRPTDIGSLLRFLNLEPLCSKELFDSWITEPIKEMKEVGLARLRTTMAHVALRRSKDLIESTLNIPEKHVYLVRVALADGPHKVVLDDFYKTTRACLVALLKIGGPVVKRKMGAVFGLLMCVRQSCCHLDLVPPYRRAVVSKVADVMKRDGIDDLSTPEGIPLLEMMIGTLKKAHFQPFVTQSDDSSEGAEEKKMEHDIDGDDEALGPRCDACDKSLNEDNTVVLRGCQHVFCIECLDLTAGQNCPECQKPYDIGSMSRELSATTPMKKKSRTPRKHRPAFVEQEHVVECNEAAGRSSKIQALLDAIGEMKPDEKGVCFSQFTSFLDIVQNELQLAGHTFTRIDGSMSAEDRIHAMEKFNTEGCDSADTPRFILCSLRACGSGINLTRANHVFLMDPWWNVATEEQAMDRVHRIGQKRDVKVVRFVIKNSVEEHMVEIQLAKAALGKGSVQRLSKHERQVARQTVLRDLFSIKDKDVVRKWDTDLTDEDSEDDWLDSDDDDEIWI